MVALFCLYRALCSGIVTHELISPKIMQTRDHNGIYPVHKAHLSQCINLDFSCMLTKESIKKRGGKSWSQLEIKQNLGQ